MIIEELSADDEEQPSKRIRLDSDVNVTVDIDEGNRPDKEDEAVLALADGITGADNSYATAE